jgi:FtsP/CotA-like multicopper oxidase with cupredoxin domain
VCFKPLCFKPLCLGPLSARPLRLKAAKLAIAIAIFVANSPALAQHQMDTAATSDQPTWRMPPMDMSMPMLPGMGSAVPAVNAFLPEATMDLSMYAEVAPPRTVDLQDGDEFELTASLVRREVSGVEFLAFAYNGQVPGPLLRVRQGSSIIVRFTNKIAMPSTVRWHGIRGDNQFDGTPVVTQDPIPQDSSFTYRVHFPDAGLFWYHPQVRADIQMDLGLYGMLLVTPEDEDYYGPVDREEVLVLDDILLDDEGPLPWGEDAPTHVLMGRFGNVLQVNGTSDYQLEVERGELVRFFVANSANARMFNLTFGGVPVKIIASDLGKYERESMVNSVTIGPGERYVVEVLFDTPGEVDLANSIQAIDHFRGIFYPRTDHLGTVHVLSESVPESREEAFGQLRESEDVLQDLQGFRKHFDRPPDRRLELTLRTRGLPLPIVRMMEIDTLYVPPIEWNDSMPMMNWVATGAQVTWVLRDMDTGSENMEIFWDFDKGDVVKIRIYNNPKTFHPMNHPIHLHGQRFLVLDYDGVRNPNLVWKDTAVIPVASTVDLLVDMSNPGEWVMHCHIAEHLHAGMMLSFTVWD